MGVGQHRQRQHNANIGFEIEATPTSASNIGDRNLGIGNTGNWNIGNGQIGFGKPANLTVVGNGGPG